MAKENSKEIEDQDNGVIDKMVNSPGNRTIVGGVIGAGVGLAMTPKNRERILLATGLMEPEKTCGQKIKDRAVNIKDSAKDKITKNDEGEEDSDSHREQDKEETPYQALKTENEELQDRLQQLEDKLDKFAESKQNSGKKSGSSKSKIPLLK